MSGIVPGGRRSAAADRLFGADGRTDERNAYRILLRLGARTAGHRNLSAGIGNDSARLRQRGRKSATRAIALRHRPGALRSGPAHGRGQCPRRRSAGRNGANHLRKQAGTVPAECRFGVRPLDRPQRAGRCRSLARAGAGRGDQRPQQPLLYGGEESGRRRGRHNSLPGGRTGRPDSGTAPHDRGRQFGDVRLLLDVRKPLARAGHALRFARPDARRDARRAAAAERREHLCRGGAHRKHQRRAEPRNGQRIAARRIPQPEPRAVQRRHGQRGDSAAVGKCHFDSAGSDL